MYARSWFSSWVRSDYGLPVCQSMESWRAKGRNIRQDGNITLQTLAGGIVLDGDMLRPKGVQVLTDQLEI